jgi:DNA-binding response OmpR family regulator
MGQDAQDPRPQVLVVDDEPELLALVCEYLALHGLAAQGALNAAQARELLAQAVPDLVILDVRMPGESGLSLARWLRSSHPGIGLMMLTSAASSSRVSKGLGR